MLCKKVILHKNRTYLYKKYGFEVETYSRIRNIFCNLKYTSGQNAPRRTYSILQSRYNSSLVPLLRNSNTLTKPRALHLNVDNRLFHNYQSLISRSSGVIGDSRWKSTDVSSSKLETMPGISINSDVILRGSSPVASTTEKIINIIYSDNEETKSILKLYPQPKSVLHNLFDVVSKKTNNNSLKISPENKLLGNGLRWVSTYHMLWPEEINVSGIDFNRNVAVNKAAIAALLWLKNNDKITDQGQPIFQEEIRVINFGDSAEHKQILKWNPNPDEVLDKVFKILTCQSCSSSAPTLQYGKTIFKENGQWLCVLHLYYPERLTFIARDPSGLLAQHKAAAAALTWLKSNANVNNLSAKSTEKVSEKKAANSTEKVSKKIAASSTEKVSEKKAATSTEKVSKKKAANRTEKVSKEKEPNSTVKVSKKKVSNRTEKVRKKKDASSTEKVSKKKAANRTEKVSKEKETNSTVKVSKKKLSNRTEKVSKNKDASSTEKVSKKKEANGTEKVSKNKVEVKKLQPEVVSNNDVVGVPEIYYLDTEKIRQILKKFPSPKNVLHNICNEVAKQANKKSLSITPQYKLIKNGKESMWVSSYHLYWPQEIKFLAKDTKKSVASYKAAATALSWLKENGKITSEGIPILYGKEEVKTLTKRSIPVLKLEKSTMDKIKKITELHRAEIMPHIIQNKLDQSEKEEDSEEDPLSLPEPHEVNLRTPRRQKYLGLNLYLAKEKVKLPIADYKDKFIDMLKKNQIIIVRGEPGCGKSTRVPQYVLEAWAMEEGLLGEPGRIAVTQPRRIAAISLAERVSSERDEAVGNIVGYQVRLKSKFHLPTGRILYCTTGILLRHFQSDPNLSSFTHIILDEAHERDVNTDLLMNLLRSACKTNPKLKLIVMSATIDTSMFSEYFGGAPIMEIPGFTYPVEQHFLESCKKIDVSKTLSMCEGKVPSVVHEDVARVIEFIHRHKKEGAILCFLPGWEDIRKVEKLIPLSGDVVVYCLHSRLQDAEQWNVFSRPPPGVRKIILATNIAETSVTIDDVVYVIDSGIQKEQRFDTEKGITCIDNHWTSKASTNQRKGRAGRVQPGESYHLYTREKYESFPDYSLPEILRTSLTKILLDCKVFSNNMNALQFMSQLPTPPEESATLRAVEELKDLAMLDRREMLTSLGTTCANFQLEPKLSKALISSVIFKCPTPVVDIVTLFAADSEFFTSGMLHKEDIKKTKSWFCKNSDHLAMMRLFETWLQYSQERDMAALRKMCNETKLVNHRMQTMEKLREIHYGYLHNGLKEVLPVSDEHSDNDEMVKAVLYSGVGTVLLHRDWDIVKQKLKKNVNCLLTRHNHRATITPESVNFKKSKFPTDFLLYINETRSNIRRMTLIRECSVIPNISVLLFSNKNLKIKDIEKEHFSPSIPSEDQVKVGIKDTNIEILCDRTQAQDLIECKNSIMAAYRYYIEQLTDTGIENSFVNNAWDSILKLISDVLSSHSPQK